MNKNNAGLRLDCAFSVVYQHEGKSHVLLPGQALPVWDVKELRRKGPPFKIVLVTMSVDEHGELVGDVGAPALPMHRYAAALAATQCLREDADGEDLAIIHQAQMHNLGGASGLATLRPHRLPIGVGLFRHQSGPDGVEQFEERPLAMTEAYPLIRKLSPRHAPYLVLPKLYVDTESPGTTPWSGADVVGTQDVLELTETMLPVCARPLEDVHPHDLLDKAMKHLERLGGRRIWLGLELRPTALTRVNGLRTTPATVEEVNTGAAPSPTLYTLPHGPMSDYFAPVRMESGARLKALMAGRDQLSGDFLPLVAEAVRVETERPEGFDVLADVVLPVM